MHLENKAFHLCCGAGGFAYGMQQSIGEYKGSVGKFRIIGGVDVDRLACEDFETLTGVPATQLDLFSRQNFIDFHGKEPPPEWREATPEDIVEAAGGEFPDTVCISAPCKGLSGLLPAKAAESKKYQALNQLTVRCIELSLKAFELDLPGLFIFENVPRIRTRGKELLNKIRELLESYGYVIVPKEQEVHDCGELGGLGQHRKRFLLIARHPEKIPAFVYLPPKLPLKSIGDVIGPMPLPGDPAAGPLHRMQNLQWKTWVRLALIPAGGDWRDLQHINPEQYRIEYLPRGGGAFGVQDWNETAKTVTGNAKVNGSNAANIADPRLNLSSGAHRALYQVCRYDEAAATVTGAAGVNNGAISIPDPRLNSYAGKHAAVYKVVRFDETGPCVTGTRFGSGAPAIADPRIKHEEGYFHHSYGINQWDKPSGTITGSHAPSSGAKTIADPRFTCSVRNGTMGVNDWDKPAKTVTASGDIHAGTSAVADPRIPKDTDSGVYIIMAEDRTWHRPLTTLELAALQTLPLILPDGRPLTLAGNSDARWREAIGNLVPPDAAKNMGNQMLIAWMAGILGWEWQLSNQKIWVSPAQSEDHISPIQAKGAGQ